MDTKVVKELQDLSYLSWAKMPVLHPLKESDEEALMYDLEDVLPEPWRKKIREMIRRRWQVYEGICNQR